MKNTNILRTRILPLAFLLLSALLARANDGAYYVSGNQLVPLQETDISIRKEILTIYLQDNWFARVDVYYEFWNPGKEVKHLLMGFEAGAPYNAYGEFKLGEGHPNIFDFTVVMNGKRLDFQNAPCVPENIAQRVQLDPSKRYYINGESGMLFEEDGLTEDEYGNLIIEGEAISFSYVYFFDAEFQPGLNVVHHTYSYRMSELVGLPWLLDYKLTPAARWAGGTIGDFSLVVRVEKTAKHFQIPQSAVPGAEFEVTEGFGKMRVANNYMDFDGDSPTSYEVSLRNGAVRWHKKDFHPEEELMINGVSWYGSGISYDRWSDIYYGSIEYDYSEADKSEKEFLLRVAHNLPYAHRGHVFKDRKLQEYFESLWWYMPDPNYKDDTSDFTKVDWQFVRARFEE